ncbi:MAG: alpha/beta hydrolase, partial [Rhodanobacteraceae bacterium]
MLHNRIAAALLSLLCAGAFAATPEVAPGNAKPEFGTLEGAAYRVDVPEKWNGSVVVFFHGYAVTPVELDEGERISPMFDGMLARGFAVIQSAYSATGWAVEEGAADSERLRKAFIAKHGAPKQTIAVGMSMGG